MCEFIFKMFRLKSVFYDGKNCDIKRDYINCIIYVIFVWYVGLCDSM